MANLDEIFSSGGESAPAVQETQTQTEKQQPEAEATQEADAPDAEHEERGVPVAALQKEREKTRRYTEEVADLRRQMAESETRWQQRIEQLVQSIAPKQPEPKGPDFWEAPEGFVDSRLSAALTPIQQALMQQSERTSRMLAEEKFGADAVKQAFVALETAVSSSPEGASAYRQIMASPHPYGALVDWHKKEALRQKIGDDPEAFIEAEIKRRLGEANGGQPPAQQSQAAMPSNFATARNVGNRSGPAWSGPAPLADIFAKGR